MLAVLVLLVVAVSLHNPDFLRAGNLLKTARQSAYVGILALGMVFALAMREVDLSVGGTYALTIVPARCSCVTAGDPWLAAVAGILGRRRSAASSTASSSPSRRVPSFIATLGNALGLPRARAGDSPRAGRSAACRRTARSSRSPAATSPGVPGAVWVLAVGGGDDRRPRADPVRRPGAGHRVQPGRGRVLSGIPTDRVRIAGAHAHRGVCAGVAGVLDPGVLRRRRPHRRRRATNCSAIAACIIGGTPLRGGTDRCRARCSVR